MRVLFVCMGNICRSPTAEAVLRERARLAGLADRLVVDSAGTYGGHAGSPPDPRAIAAGARRGYDLAPLRARAISRDDFTRFDCILAMDSHNLRALRTLRPDEFGGYLGRAMDFAPGDGRQDVADPFYGGPAGFEDVLDMLEAVADGLLEELRRRAQAA
jgi:protein-tyrosine phosphatase